MAGETRIIAFNANGSEARENAELRRIELETASQDPVEDHAPWTSDDDPTPSKRGNIVAPIAACTAILCWTGFFAWSQWSAIQSARPTDAPIFATQWATPVLLIIAIWLLAMRTSTREATRFGHVGAALSRESASLQARMSAINTQLNLTREFITEQSRELEALGQTAVERLSQQSERLASLISDNGTYIQSIHSVSGSALENMERLGSQLPALETAAKDVTDQIGVAGLTSQTQLENLAAGFDRLHATSVACADQVSTVRAAMEAADAQSTLVCDELHKVATVRFETLAARTAEIKLQIEAEESHALSAIRTRADTLAGEIDRTRALLDDHEAESLTSLRARLTSLRDEIGVVGRSLNDSEARAADVWQTRLTAVEGERAALEARVADAERISLETLRERTLALVQISDELRTRFSQDEHDAFKTLEDRTDRIRSYTAELHAHITASEQQALARLTAELTAMDSAIADRLNEHQQQSDAIVWRSQAIAGSLIEHGEKIAQIAQNTGEMEAALTRSLTALSNNLSTSQANLTTTERDVHQLTNASVRLLELIKASANHSSGALTEALTTADLQLVNLGEKLLKLVENIDAGAHRTNDLNIAVEGVHKNLAALQSHLEDGQAAISDRNNTHYTELNALRASIEDLERSSERVHTRTKVEMNSAIERLAVSVRSVLSMLQDEGGAKIRALAEQLGADSADAIDRIMRPRTAEATSALEQAVVYASGAGLEVATQMRAEITSVTEALGHLEGRIEQARSRAQDQVDNDFSRRAALISDALKSNAIDVAKALSSEVADTAWSAYLRGDRGIFTRRAVSLLDTSEAKSVQQLFERDDTFRENVNRYIHDFEALLRQILSTRDGNALGVTLLSSDIGKLYVALAQGIERLRN